VGTSEKKFVLCVKKKQLCTCIILFGTFFQAIFYGGRREHDEFFLPRSLFLKIAAFFYEMLNKQDKLWEDTNSAYLVKFFTAIVLLIALSSLMHMSSACLAGRPPGQPGGIVKWVEQSWGFPPGVRKFNKTKSPGSSASQRKIPQISGTSYN